MMFLVKEVCLSVVKFRFLILMEFVGFVIKILLYLRFWCRMGGI